MQKLKWLFYFTRNPQPATRNPQPLIISSFAFDAVTFQKPPFLPLMPSSLVYDHLKNQSCLNSLFYLKR